MFLIVAGVLAVCSCSSLLPADYEAALKIVAPDNASPQTLTTNLNSLLLNKEKLFRNPSDEDSLLVASMLIETLIENPKVDISMPIDNERPTAIDKTECWIEEYFYESIVAAMKFKANKAFCSNWKLPIVMLKSLESQGYYTQMEDILDICPDMKLDAAALARAFEDKGDYPVLADLLVGRCPDSQIELLAALPISLGLPSDVILGRVPDNKRRMLAASNAAFERALQDSNIAKPYTFDSLIDWLSMQSNLDESVQRMVDRVLAADTTLESERVIVQNAAAMSNSTVVAYLLESKHSATQQRIAISTLQSLGNCAEAMKTMNLSDEYCTCTLSAEGLGRCIYIH